MLTGGIEIDGAVIGVVIHINRRQQGSNQPDFLIYATEEYLTVADDQIAKAARIRLGGQ